VILAFLDEQVGAGNDSITKNRLGSRFKVALFRLLSVGPLYQGTATDRRKCRQETSNTLPSFAQLNGLSRLQPLLQTAGVS